MSKDIASLKFEDPDFEGRLIFESVKQLLLEELDELIDIATNAKMDSLAVMLARRKSQHEKQLSYDAIIKFVRDTAQDIKRQQELIEAQTKAEPQDNEFGNF